MEDTVTTFHAYTPENAPDASEPLLDTARRKYGFVPELYAYLAESPPALQAYFDLSARFEQTSFNPAERQALLLAISVENACEFCVAAHSMAARRAGAPDAVVDALRAMRSVPDAHYAALTTFAQAVVRERGWVTGAPLETFLDSGFTPRQVIEVVLATAMKTLSNYVNHMTGARTNPELSAEAWHHPA
jgi:uncharacterized peroxidase-related enzyme